MSKFNITEALIYENQGLKEEALEIYKKILESDPDNFKAAAHFEHTVAVRNGKAEILSSFDEIENFEQQ